MKRVSKERDQRIKRNIAAYRMLIRRSGEPIYYWSREVSKADANKEVVITRLANEWEQRCERAHGNA